MNRDQFSIDALNTIKSLRNTLLDIEKVLPSPEITAALKEIQDFAKKYVPKPILPRPEQPKGYGCR